ncbi:MAG: DUF4843 domain-containing protein [Dysgonamonadaceae bacterium]|nr:DUF4843 domain-containing protein [Dysgonamonadaceae bacterium]
MKTTIITYLAMLTMLFVVSSCSKNETPVFDSNYSALNIWFGTASVTLDSATYNYSYSLERDSLMFQARVIGLPVDYDRTFSLETIDGDIGEADGSYETLTYTIPAGETSREFAIYFNTSKLKDSQAFTTRDGHLTFQMSTNDEFAAGANNMRYLRIVLKNYLAKPAEWDTAPSGYRALSYYFGAYSKVKYSFMIQIMGLVDFHISTATAFIGYNVETNTMSTAYAAYMLTRLKVALEEYNASHNTPLTDETGSAVVF